MQQMPEEGRLFGTVDRNWKDIMRNTIRDPHVRETHSTIVHTQINVVYVISMIKMALILKDFRKD